MVGRALVAGDITEATFRTCVFRTGLIDDDDVMALVDQRLSVVVPRWGVMNRSQVAGRIDKIVAGMDLDAVRRRRDRIADRDVVMGDVDRGLSEIHATSSHPTPTPSANDSPPWPPRSARPTRAPSPNAGPTPSGCWPPAGTGWAANAGSRTAPPAVERPVRLSST
jgi:hypothetical protein